MRKLHTPKDVEREKLINAIIYFVTHDTTVKLTKLMKLLYYLDFRNFKETGRSVTGQQYKAWPMGPVPTDVWQEIRCHEDRGLHLSEIASLLPVPETLDAFGFDLRLKGKPKFSDYYFSKQELSELANVSEIFKSVPANKIIDATHLRGLPWEKTLKTKGPKSVIDYDLALDGCPEERKQQILEERRDRQCLEQIYGDLY